MPTSSRLSWVITALSFVACVAAVAVVGLTVDFVRTLVATFVGAALGFLVALYIDRAQRQEADEARRRQLTEDDRKQRDRDQEAEHREAERQVKLARERRVAVLSLLREELGRVPDQMGQRQNRNQLPFDRLTDIVWRSFSSSGELRWIDDIVLLRKLASAYDLLSVEIALESRWAELRLVTSGNAPQADSSIANQLRGYDRDAWRLACEACKAMDNALRADGAPAGANADKLFCP